MVLLFQGCSDRVWQLSLRARLPVVAQGLTNLLLRSELEEDLECNETILALQLHKANDDHFQHFGESISRLVQMLIVPSPKPHQVVETSRQK